MSKRGRKEKKDIDKDRMTRMRDYHRAPIKRLI
jgi:hypothetical protein